MIHVLDSSVLLAVSKGERGAEFVIALINTKDCVISSVNMAEVATRLLDMGLPAQELNRAVAQLGVDVIDFNQEQALACAALRPLTKSAGLSLGDRACLALAKLMQGCSVTGDRAWMEIEDAVGVKVLMIR
ncbi:MAG: type II toxin-antitoxin system VapC family toxin [Burkholderiaceae bacterium]